MSRTVDSWQEKIQSFRDAWAQHPTLPTLLDSTIVQCLAVAEHETQCGDSKGWEGEHNWGAVQLRILSPAERAWLTKEGIVAHPNNVSKARLVLATGGFPEPHGVLHVDSSPGKGWYWVYFWAFPDDIGGASQLIHILVENMSRVRAFLLLNRLDPGTMAGAMYSHGYFEGFHVRNHNYKRAGTTGVWVDVGDEPGTPGASLNISDYSAAIGKFYGPIQAALSGDPTSDPTPTQPTKSNRYPDATPAWSVADTQVALNNWKRARPGVFIPQLKADGIYGERSQAGVRVFQSVMGLDVDGVVGPMTTAALRPFRFM